MPMNMGIHRKPIGHSRLAFLDSRLRGNDGGMFFPGKRLRCPMMGNPAGKEAATGGLFAGSKAESARPKDAHSRLWSPS